MTVAKLSVTLRKVETDIDRLKDYALDMQGFEPRYQYFIAEMIMLRLFTIFEDGISEAAFKIAAGASYLDGRVPDIAIRASTVSASRGILMSYGRSREVKNLKWTQAKHIVDSIKYVIPESESFISNVRIHGATINEMRKVRNVLAHKSSSAKSDYREVLRQNYGAYVNVVPGAFLTSTKRSSISKLQSYLTSTRIIFNDVLRGS